MKSHQCQVMRMFFTLNGSFRLRDAVFLAKVVRHVTMPSTSRKLLISEKFCEAAHFLLVQAAKQNQNFAQIPWRRTLFSRSLIKARKRL